MHPDFGGLLLVSHRVIVDSSDATDPDFKGVLGSMHNVVINNGDSSSISEAVITLGVIFMVIVLPVILHYQHKRLKLQAGSPQPDGASTELWERARRMETRIEYLERVLDSEMPGWRNRS